MVGQRVVPAETWQPPVEAVQPVWQLLQPLFSSRQLRSVRSWLVAQAFGVQASLAVDRSSRSVARTPGIPRTAVASRGRPAPGL